jgi:hypothetical protein
VPCFALVFSVNAVVIRSLHSTLGHSACEHQLTQHAHQGQRLSHSLTLNVGGPILAQSKPLDALYVNAAGAAYVYAAVLGMYTR